MNRFKESKLFFWTIELLAIFLLVWTGTKISFVFYPIGAFFSVLFTPLIIAGFLYYLMNPLVEILEKIRVKRMYAILALFGFVIFLAVIVLTKYIPILVSQINQLILGFPEFLTDLQNTTISLMDRFGLDDQTIQNAFAEWNVSFSELIKNTFSNVSSGLTSFIGIISRVTVVLITAPAILFFMLKEGDQFSQAVVKFFPENFRKEALDLFVKLNSTLSSYITGQALVCLYVGIFTTIGYFIIGMPYALLLGTIAGVMDIIPYLGPWIGIAPAFFIAFSISPLQALLVVGVVLIVQLGESYFVSPFVLGKHLKVHPLTIILILLVAGNIAGLMGMILAIPVYAISKEILINVYSIYQEHKKVNRA